MCKTVPTLVLLLASAAPARGRLAVVEVDSPPSMMGLSAQLTRMLLQSAGEQGYAVVGPEELSKRLGLKRYQELQACRGNAGCASSKLGGVAPRAVLGTLGRDERSYLVKLWLVDLENLSLLAEVDRSILIASRRLMSDVEAAIPGLLRGEKEARGTLKLSANVKAAAVWLDGEAVGKTPLTLELKPGKHELRVEKKAHLPVDRLVAVEAGQLVEIEIRLLLKPGEVAEAELPPMVGQQLPEGAGSGIRVPTAAWVAGGVALAALAGASYFGSSSWSAQQRLKQGYDPERGFYQGTRAEALSAQQQAAVANVGFAVAGAALAAGVVFTVLEF